MNLCTNSYHALEDHGGEIKVELNKIQPDDSLNLHIKALIDKPVLIENLTKKIREILSKTMD
jgi:hypothetical protein